AAPASAAPVDISAAYQYLHVSSAGGGESLPAGFALGVRVPTMNGFGVIGDFGWNTKTDSGVKAQPASFGAGIRFIPMADRMAAFHPYIQVVAGAERTKVTVGSASDSQTKFMIQPGVGVSFPMGKWSSFVEANYRRVSSDPSANDVVARAGINLTFGK
ncbi:MAG TPA: outer membrane beta-barrel protein, partial [Vicinamibacterales bacterium]|nr:outer membrane beta-barrel protein [Vicinamibacterales bacterium]